MNPLNRAKLSPVESGFTLLEVLIALAILAISALAVMTQTGQSLTQLDQLKLKTVAVLVAENQLTALQITPNWPSVGRSDNSVSFADLQWQVKTEVSSTSDPWLRKIEVTVFYGDNSDAVLADLVGYRGRY